MEHSQIRTSESIQKLSVALVKAQSAFGLVNLDKKYEKYYQDKKTNQWKSFTIKYASLNSVWQTIKGPLSQNKLMVFQAPTGASLVTRIIHESGEYIEFCFEMPKTKGGAQEIGSAITYSKRYCISAMLGIVTDEDDDGRSAQAGKQVSNTKKTSSATTQKPTSRSQIATEDMSNQQILLAIQQDMLVPRIVSGKSWGKLFEKLTTKNEELDWACSYFGPSEDLIRVLFKKTNEERIYRLGQSQIDAIETEFAKKQLTEELRMEG